uniref:Copia protein n=1 Tax=Cajanus cajan TaxID=3821 RepID=A0A151TF49_CAJCA|nr:Copia protein [Cajanus cajan]
MAIPPGYEVSDKRLVCRLQKSLYGLRQASRSWYAKLSQALIKFGFNQCHSNHSLFTYSSGSIFLVTLIYVDDLIIAGNDSNACASFKQYLNQCFHMKDLGTLTYFLGLELSRGNTGFCLCQRKYTLDIFKESGMLDCKPATFPMEQNHNLASDKGELFSDPPQYRRLIGRLIYLTITRPEITYSIHILSQFMQEPRQPHWEAAIRILKYLKSSPGQGILIPRHNDLKLEGFCDLDWASCPTTRRLISGYLMKLGSVPISWKTKKQTTISRSSSEVEYRAMTNATSEIIWLRGLLSALQVPCCDSTILHCDNQSAIHIANNPVFHERTKHIEVDFHFIREHIQSGTIFASYLHTRQQLADIFTKALGCILFHDLLSKLVFKILTSQVEGE